MSQFKPFFTKTQMSGVFMQKNSPLPSSMKWLRIKQ